MEDSMKITINNFGVIRKADLNLGKITVVGGHNSTGKSIVGKVLFSLLKANSSKRRDLASDSVGNQIKQLLFRLMEYSRIDSQNILSSINLIDYFDKLNKNNDFKSKLEVYNDLKDIYHKMDLKNGYKRDFDNIFEIIDDLINIINKDDFSLYYSIVRNLFKSEFSTLSSGFINFSGVLKDISYECIVDLKNHDFDDDEAFRYNGGFSINDVFYIDSVSALDLSQHFGLQNTSHFQFLQDCIKPEADESKEIFDEKINEKIITIEKEVKNIINGHFKYDDEILIFISDSGSQTVMKDTASGVKQLGIIQLLLSHRKLKENSFIILDEPEVNLHPKWQVKLAKILVLLASELNIRLYINSHSPMFIEAMSIFSQYYKLEKEAMFYLTRQKDNFCDFVKIANDDMGAVYENLAKPYDELDTVKI